MTPIILNDRYRNETTFTHLQPHLLHAQWHSVSAVTEKNIRSMALIVVYRYDIFYIPWPLEVSTPIMDTDVGKKNISTDGRMTNTNNSQTPSPTSYIDDKEDYSDGNSSSKLPGKLWPYGPVRRITTTGAGSIPSSVGIISNGVADYLYESKTLISVKE